MTDKKNRIESLFASQTRAIIKFHYPILIIILAISFGLASQIRYLTIDTSNEGLLHEDDEILLTYNGFRDQFGRDDLLVMAITSGKKEIFSLEFLEKLQKFHEQLAERVPHISEINSLVNARNTRGEGDTLLVDDLLAHFPENDREIAALKELVLSNPTYTNMLISADGTFTTVLLQSDTYSSAGSGSNGPASIDDELAGFDDELTAPADDETSVKPEYLTDQKNAAMVRVAQEIAKEFNSPDFQILTAGSPVVTHTVKQLMMADMKRFLRLAVLTIGICLFLMFRRITGVVLPLLIVGLTLASTLGIMAKMGIFFKTPTIILPSFLLAVGVGASIHVLSLVYQYLRKDDNQNDAIVHAYSHSGFAIVMTSLTTAAGLASFATAEVAPIADLGLFSAVGVMLSLFFTIFLLPALLAIIPLKKKAETEKNKVTPFDRLIDWVADVTTSRPKLIVAVAAVGIILALAGLPRLQFSHNLLSWLPDDLPVRTATESIDHNLRGSVALEVVLDTGKENGLYDRDVLLAINTLTDDLEQFKQDDLFVGKVIAVTTILKEIHQALNENRPEMYAIPDNGALIPQEFLLFENSGSDDLQDFVDSRFQLARITIKVPWQDSLAYVPFIKEIEQRFSTAFADLDKAGKPVQVTTTGIMALFARILHATMYSAVQSYGIALVVISIMMILLIGNLRLGLIAMIPNLGPILIVMGIMGWFAIPLDMFTMMVASVAIGLAVDDTVHFIYNFKRYYTKSGDVRDAVGHTLHTAGRAMLTTSIVLSIGFFIFMFASMNNVFNFGMLVGMAIILALLGDFFLAPALMALSADKMLNKEESNSIS